ncbi:LysR substrate-binding domain-containing protein [Roseateles sp. SL47]|uniref:LysR family transcriptional regulator n=1 Tax=Roseateles sp. SL47 TaxID=2995138 RepID=UPI00226EE5B7|nr:LysR substrate-binding domain-containing protein [Roseateles sp. SL47]WAC72663.1 LysR substrate-binding domain-containing protein [Roseateles sp. SL47]
MLDALKLFLTIIEKGGLSAAGRELGLSPASVSERLAALEAHYGVALLTRTTRSLRLTEEGRTLAEGARRLLAESEELESRVRLGAEKLSGPVRLSAPVDLGQSRLVPLLDRFMEQHPDVSIDLDLTDGFVDLVSQGMDFAVRYGSLADSSLKAKLIGENRRVVCAAPSYLQRRGRPSHPDDLVHHDCLIMRFGLNSDRVWNFRIHGQPHSVTVKGRRTANNGELVRRWCLQGHGLCRKSVWDVQADLDAGRLVELLPEFNADRSALQIVYAPTRVQPRRVRSLIELIAAELAQPTTRRDE